MKLLGTLLLVSALFFKGFAQNEQVEPTYVNEPSIGGVLFTSALSGLNLYAGLANIHLGARGESSVGLNMGGAILGSVQTIFGFVMIATSNQSISGENNINRSQMYLGGLNIGLGLFSFSSALFSSGNRDKTSSSSNAWNFRANTIPDGRGGFQLGFSRKF